MCFVGFPVGDLAGLLGNPQEYRVVGGPLESPFQFAHLVDLGVVIAGSFVAEDLL